VEAVELLVDSLQPGVVQLLDALGPLVVGCLIFLLFILGRLVAHGTSVTLIVTSISIFLQHLLLCVKSAVLIQEILDYFAVCVLA